MILLLQNRQEYNNDIRAMIMAFYPGIRIVEETKADQPVQFVFRAVYGPDKTVLSLEEPNEADKLIAQEEIPGDFMDKQVFRNQLKRASYALMCRYTGRTLPWGDLTGVRPTKIAMKKFQEGSPFDEIVTYYMDTYAVSVDKARLATRVAQKELELVRDVDPDRDYCLYVGIPFCPSRCLYCSFTSYPIGVYAAKAERYVDRLIEELEFIAGRYADKRLVAVYIGGGTPTSISHTLLDRLLTAIEEIFSLKDAVKCGQLLEFTVEAGRPDSITKEKLCVMKKHGVTRISINPQTMNDETLRTIGRAHTADQTREAFALARQVGFDNINMDLIAGLPGEDLDSMHYTLEQIRMLGPESLTVHSLAIKRAANLRQQLDTYGETINQDMDEMHVLAEKVSTELGMEPYYMYRQKNIGGNLENVGYAKPGTECIYNVLIMEEMTDIVAAGAGGSTKLTFHAENRVERVENCKSVDDYIDRFDEMIERKRKATAHME
ncbi:MAG: coproporphyrinogen dehydrogenase HemZ [Wujia sp.]